MKKEKFTQVLIILRLVLIAIFFSFSISKYTKADTKFNKFHSNLTEIAILMNSINGITAKCFTLEITEIINTSSFWEGKLRESLSFAEEPAYLIGFFDEYIIKYHNNKHDPMDFDIKEGKFTKKYYRKYENMTTKSDCLGNQNSNAYQIIEQKKRQTKIAAAMMFGSFAKIENNKSNSYLSYLKTEEPAVFKFLIDGLNEMDRFQSKR